MSQTSPAVVLFRTEDITPKSYAEEAANIIYPTGKEGNIVYACLKLPRRWVVDAVEVYNTTRSPTARSVSPPTSTLATPR